MSMTTQDLITYYKGERSDAKLGQQLLAIPRRDDMIYQQVFYYFVGDRRKVAVDFTREFCFRLNHLKLKGMSPERYRILQESTTPMETLINAGLIYPFALFLNGRFIPWENITIIASREQYYLLVHDLPNYFFDLIKGEGGKMITDFHTIILPDKVQYKQGYWPITDKTIFAFSEVGEFASSSVGYITIDSYDDDELEIIDIDNPQSSMFAFSDDLTYKYFSENVFVFKNSLYVEPQVDIIGTVLQLYDSTELPEGYHYVRVIHNKKLTTPTYDSIGKLNFSYVENDLLNYISGAKTRYLEFIADSFDPKMSRDVGYEQNKRDFLNYLATYDLSLFNMVYSSNKDYIDLEVDGAWMLAHRDDDGYFKIPRRFKNRNDYYIMILINGELYKYYRHHFYDKGYFFCPVQGIEATDVVEIMYFKNAKNYALPANISTDDPYENYDKNLYDKYLRVYSSENRLGMFTFPSDGIQTFPVNYSFEYDPNDSSKLRIRFDDSWYYDKDVMITSSKRFAYASYPITGIEEGTDYVYFKVDLGDHFKYCNEYDKFVVFINGRRLINDLYRIILPYRQETPFSRAVLYLCVPIKNDDIIEVFYLPNHFVDIIDTASAGDLDSSGIITISKDKLAFSLDKDLVSVWINCRKIPQSQIKNISSTKLMVTGDLTSVRDVRVTTMINDEDLYEEFKTRFQTIQSNWDSAIAANGHPAELLGYTAPSISETDPDPFPEEIEVDAIMLEIIRDWYLGNAMVDTTGPFYYGYDDVDSSIKGETDPAGNTMLEVMDSNKENSLNVDRYWP